LTTPPILLTCMLFRFSQGPTTGGQVRQPTFMFPLFRLKGLPVFCFCFFFFGAFRGLSSPPQATFFFVWWAVVSGVFSGGHEFSNSNRAFFALFAFIDFAVRFWKIWALKSTNRGCPFFPPPLFGPPPCGLPAQFSSFGGRLFVWRFGKLPSEQTWFSLVLFFFWPVLKGGRILL